MPDQSPSTAGGFFIVMGLAVGAVVGLLVGQATPGALIGLAAGVVGALLVWQRDRRR